MKYLTLEEVLYLHQQLIVNFGGTGGIHDFGLLHSAIERPKASFGGKDLYPDVYEKVAALVYSLINNHPFVEGNKRTGVAAMLITLNQNDVKIKLENQELVKFALDIEAKKMDIKGIAGWIKSRIK